MVYAVNSVTTAYRTHGNEYCSIEGPAKPFRLVSTVVHVLLQRLATSVNAHFPSAAAVANSHPLLDRLAHASSVHVPHLPSP